MASFIATALEGDFLARLDEIARLCGRVPVGQIMLYDNWPTVASLARQKNHLAAAISGDWTVLVDNGDLTSELFDNPETASDLSYRYGARVVTAFGSSVSGSCGYRVYAPSGTRSVVVEQDVVLEDEGEPLPGEDTSDLELHDLYSVLEVLELIGVDVADGVESSTRCALLRLDDIHSD